MTHKYDNQLAPLWTVLKVLLSAFFLLAAFLGVVAFVSRPSLGTIASILVACAIAVLPWAPRLGLPTLPKELLFGLISSVLLFPALVLVAADQLQGKSGYPRTCSGRRAGCEFFNWLHGNGGNVLVSGFTAVFALLALAGGIVMLARWRNRKL